jgi:adenosylcobyric acid synthase
MVLGTSSHAGKSLTVAALCRIIARNGYRVAPFKAQNMSLNSAATLEGLEIGRAQALQAEAAGIPATVHMNPVLIKPGSEISAQIVVRGKAWRTLDARTYFSGLSTTLLPVVEESYRALAGQYDVVLLEGAGSPAEINLKHNDIVNMRMARLADAPCILVGDIDRGGVFASLLGTRELLDEDEQRLLRGFLINKFRGDRSLLMPGVRMMEQRLSLPCIGVIPWLDHLDLDEEDSAGFAERNAFLENRFSEDPQKLRIAAIAFPSISNFTDFAPLLAEPSVSLRYVREPRDLASAALIILPGSKQTVQDLRWLQEHGFEEPLHRHIERGGLVAGICGGLQMLGEEIYDPSGVEGANSAVGLGLLPLHTTLTTEKVTVPVKGRLCERKLFGAVIQNCYLSGYEIHMGETEYLPGAAPFAHIRRGSHAETEIMDGCVSQNQRIVGTYLHGLFDDDVFRHDFLSAARAAMNMAPVAAYFGWRKHREQQLDRLADSFAAALDLEAIYGLLDLPSRVVRQNVLPAMRGPV